MKYTLKNKPTIEFNQPEEFDEWFEGFEKELRELLEDWQNNKVFKNTVFWEERLIKEILGDNQK